MAGQRLANSSTGMRNRAVFISPDSSAFQAGATHYRTTYVTKNLLTSKIRYVLIRPYAYTHRQQKQDSGPHDSWIARVCNEPFPRPSPRRRHRSASSYLWSGFRLKVKTKQLRKPATRIAGFFLLKTQGAENG
jgi:hypothetical protein